MKARLTLRPSTVAPLTFFADFADFLHYNEVHCDGPFGITVFANHYKLEVYLPKPGIGLRVATHHEQKALSDIVWEVHPGRTRSEHDDCVSPIYNGDRFLMLEVRELEFLDNIPPWIAPLFDNVDHSDVELVCSGNSNITCKLHQLVLSQFTDYFSDAVKHNDDKKVVILASEWQATMGVLRFCYTGQIDTTMRVEQTVAMYIGAEMLCMRADVLKVLAVQIAFSAELVELLDIATAHAAKYPQLVRSICERLYVDWYKDYTEAICSIPEVAVECIKGTEPNDWPCH